MADWKDSLRPASFRGVPFFVDDHEASYGRRQATHEFPQRDEPYTEDLGRAARTYTVNGYLIGDDYPDQRKRLIDACEGDGGAGELVHPYLGSVQVTCGGLKVSESATEGRICKISLTFTEAGKPKFPTEASDPTKAITGAANGLTDAAKGGFLGGFLTGGFPAFVADAAQAQLANLSSFISGLPFNPVAEAQAVADYFGQVSDLASQALQLVTSPIDLANQVIGIIGGVRDLYGARADGVLRAMIDGNPGTYTGSTATPSRKQQETNTKAIAALVRRCGLAERAKVAMTRSQESLDAIRASAQAATTMNRRGATSATSAGTATSSSGETGSSTATSAAAFLTRDDVQAMREALTDQIDAEMEDPTTTDAEFSALADLRAELVRNVPAPDLALPRVATYTPQASLPSLVVAHAVYGTAARATEIAQRNHARHPGFLPGGTELEVLTDG